MGDMIEITADLVQRELSNIVAAAAPNYRYKDHFNVCRNYLTPTQAVDGKSESSLSLLWGERPTDENAVPGCIVGQFFHVLGIKYSECGNQDVRSSISQIQRNRTDVTITKTAFLMLAIAQAVQDAGGTWGEAQAAAFRVRMEMRLVDGSFGSGAVIEFAG